MKPIRSILTAGMMLAVFVNTAPALTLPVSEDTSTSATPALARSAGKENTLHVSATRHGLIRFEAGAFAESFATGDISKARLVLFLSRVTSPGALTIHRITEEWSEDGAGTPAYDPTPLATIPRSSVVGKQFVIVDVTPTVKGWLKKPSSDFGFAIVSSGNTNVLLGSKEGPATGYPAQLQIEGGAAIAPDANTNDPGTNVLTINSLTGDAATGITVTKMARKAYVVSSSANSANTANAIVKRDGSGNFAAGTITGSFSGNGSGLTSLNAANLTGTLPALSGANLTNLNGANLTGGSVTSAKLASGLTLGGTTAGSFSGPLTGNADTATSASTIIAADTRLSVTNTGTFGQSTGFLFDTANNAAGDVGLLLETSASSESAGLFLNGNTAVLYSPGDTIGLFVVYDEDNLVAPPAVPVPAFVVLDNNDGISTPGGGTFGGDVTVNGKSVAVGEEQLRIVRGSVIGGTGAAEKGAGFTSVRNSTGFYTITFANAFTSPPSVTGSFRGNSDIIVSVGTATNTTVAIFVNNVSNLNVDGTFDFIAVGPR